MKGLPWDGQGLSDVVDRRSEADGGEAHDARSEQSTSNGWIIFEWNEVGYREGERERFPPGTSKRLSSVQCQTRNSETNCGSNINLSLALTSLSVEIVHLPLPDEFVQQHRVGVERRETLRWRLTVPPTSPRRPAIPARHTYCQV